MHQQQTEPQGPGADGGQDEGHGAVRLQEEVAGVELPQEQQQHERVQPQSPAAARDQEVRTEGVTAATVVEAPAQVTGERHVEEEQLYDSHHISETAFQKVSIDEHPEGEAGPAVAVYHLSDKPWA